MAAAAQMRHHARHLLCRRLIIVEQHGDALGERVKPARRMTQQMCGGPRRIPMRRVPAAISRPRRDTEPALVSRLYLRDTEPALVSAYAAVRWATSSNTSAARMLTALCACRNALLALSPSPPAAQTPATRIQYSSSATARHEREAHTPGTPSARRRWTFLCTTAEPSPWHQRGPGCSRSITFGYRWSAVVPSYH